MTADSTPIPLRSLKQHVQITVTCDNGHVMWTGLDAISEKYPFYCEECGEQKAAGKYPWTLSALVVYLPEDPKPE